MADRIAIMSQGVIELVGTIQELLTKPSSMFIAEFTWTRNFSEGFAEMIPDGCCIRTASGLIIHSTVASVNGPVTFGIRPEELVLTSAEKASPGGNHLKAKIVRVMFRPSSLEVELDAGFPLIAYHPWNSEISRQITDGDILWISFRPEAVMVFPNDNGGKSPHSSS